MATKRTPTTPTESRMTTRKTEAPMVSKREASPAQPAKPTPATPASKEVAPPSGRNAQGTTPPDRMAETVKNTGAPAVTKNGTGSPSKAAGNAASTDFVDDEAIAARAYEKFLARGGEHGYHIEDWLAAEAELRGTQS